MTPTNTFWKTFPRRSKIIFLLGVFLIFTAIAFVSDMMGMGSEHPFRLGLNVLITGAFPVFYAFAGFALRLGLFPSGDFASSGIQMEHEDVLALYTDGFPEQANAAGEEFGLARLQSEFQAHVKHPLQAICLSLQEIVARHGAQFDDQSLLLIRKL